MSLIILLFSLGIGLLVIEVIVPGGILGMIGGLLMLGGGVVAWQEFGLNGAVIALTIAIALMFLAFFIELKVLPKTKLGKRAFLSAQVTGVSAAVGQEARELVGKSAEALTMLSPSGYVRVEGKRYEAFCLSGQVPVGAALQVTGADNFRLIVSQQKDTQTPLQP